MLCQEVISHFDSDVMLYRHCFSLEDSDRLYSQLYDSIHWRQDSAKFFGKTHALPRLTAWYGERGKSYSYSGIRMEPEPWTAPLLEVKARVEQIIPQRFNSVLLNLYRHGQDSMGWHSDDEPSLGSNPAIASVSFGGTRRFRLRHRFQKETTVTLELDHGSLLIMSGPTQHYWQHQVPKTSKPVSPRINLTFRVIVDLQVSSSETCDEGYYSLD